MVVPESENRYDRRAELIGSLGLPERFILYVGTIQPRMNLPFLVRSFAHLKRTAGLPHKLVLAGGRDAAESILDSLIRELGLSDEVILTGYVEDWQIPLLYKMADLFVLPTRYEGFTLVTLEAMTYGVPVVATDSSSIREGVGDAALLVPVDDDAALSRAIGEVLSDESLRARLIREGRERASLFTWENCARETAKLYRELASASVS